MNPPSKPVLIALAGVAGLVVVVGGVLFLRYRSGPEEHGPLPATSVVAPPSTPALEEKGSTSTSMESEPPDGKGQEIPADRDGDGLSDEEESRAGTMVNLRDSDGDGVTDYEEIRVYQTDPLFFTPTSVTTSSPESTPPSASEPLPPPSVSPLASQDADGDGLTNQDEVRYQTNPTNRDSDGDGYPDGEEVQKGYNPRGSGKCATSTCLP